MGCSTDPLQELLPESVVVRAPCWRQGVPGERLGSISTGRSGPSPARLCPSPVLKALQPLQASLQSLTTWWHGKPVLFSRNFSGVNLRWSLLGLLLPPLRRGQLCCPCGGCGVGSSCPPFAFCRLSEPSTAPPGCSSLQTLHHRGSLQSGPAPQFLQASWEAQGLLAVDHFPHLLAG